MIKELKTAAAYIRVSTDKQEELSPASQLKEIKKWAKDNGYILTNDYIFMENEGVSGRKADNRLEFQRMIATAKTKPKPFDAIILWKFSRFARNQEEATFYKGLLRRKLGIDVISISEPILEGMFGRLIEMIIEWFDEYYSVNLSGEVMRGMTEKAQRGGYQSELPYGYRMNKDTHLPDIIPEEAAIVKLIYDMGANPSYSYLDIARKLNDMNVKTKRGNTWEVRTIMYILQNPFYYGYVRWNRQHHESHTVKDASEWIITKGVHEPLVSEEQYKAVGEIMRYRATRRAYNHKAAGTKHWLSGLIKCDCCGSSLFLGSTSGKDNTRSLQCGGYQKGKCKVSHSITETKLVDGLTLALKELLNNTDINTYHTVTHTVSIPEHNYINEALAKLDQKEKRIKQAYRDGIDTLEEYKENKSIINEERRKLEEELERINNTTQTEVSKIDLPSEINNIINIINSDASNTVKGDSIRSIIDHAVFIKSENRLEIHLADISKTL